MDGGGGGIIVTRVRGRRVLRGERGKVRGEGEGGGGEEGEGGGEGRLSRL